jgi:hypothetical protein
VQDRPVAAGVEEGVALRVGGLAGRAAEDVVHTVAIHVAGVGDREAVLVARRPLEAPQRRAGAAGVDPRGAGLLGAAPRLADDDVAGAVAVHVRER